MRDRFTFRTVTERIAFADEPDETGDFPYTVEYDEGDPETGDLSAALDALCSVYYFDTIDVDGAGTVIGYAADGSINYRTGEYERDTVIVEADRPANAHRLLDAFEAKRKRDDARLQAYREGRRP